MLGGDGVVRDQAAEGLQLHHQGGNVFITPNQEHESILLLLLTA